MRAKFSNALIDNIIQLYTVECLPYYKIAKRLKVSTDTIHKILSDSNITIRHQCHRVNVGAEELNELYTIQHLPSTEIARHFGITFPTVLKKLRENNIPIRPKHGNPFAKSRIKQNELPLFIKEPKIINHKITGIVTCPSCNKTRRLSFNRNRMAEIIKANGRCGRCAMKARIIPLDIESVKHLYYDGHLTTNEIATKFNVSPHTIIKAMRRNGTPIRTKGETRELAFKSKIHNKGTLEAPILGDIRQGYHISLNDKAYYIRVACLQCKQERWEVKSRIKKHPLCKPCAMVLNGENHRGEKAPMWQGGISFEPYTSEFNEHLKEQVRERDNHTCQLCGTPKNGKALAVHHIDYNKKNSHPNNLISLCPSQKGSPSCHAKTGHNRQYWTQYFSELLKNRGVLVPISKQNGNLFS